MKEGEVELGKRGNTSKGTANQKSSLFTSWVTVSPLLSFLTFVSVASWHCCLAVVWMLQEGCVQRFCVLEAFLSNLRPFELILSTRSLLKFSRKASLLVHQLRVVLGDGEWGPASRGLNSKPLKCYVKTVCPKDALGCSQSDMTSLNMRLCNCNTRWVLARFGHTNKILLFLFVLAYPHIIMEF